MDEKPKFVPNVPASRPVRKPTAPKKEKTLRKKVQKKADPTEAVASGPFALGPAKRSAAKITRGVASSSSIVKVKSESLAEGAEKVFINSDDESDQGDLEFDALDPNAPLSISNQSNQLMHDQLKVDQNDLVLIQVPDILTSIIASSCLESPAEADTVMVKQETMVPNVDSKKGKIGSLVIHPDGRMELRISSLSFDISNAPESHLLQKLVVVDGEIATDLGKVSQRMMCTPQIE